MIAGLSGPVIVAVILAGSIACGGRTGPPAPAPTATPSVLQRFGEALTATAAARNASDSELLVTPTADPTNPTVPPPGETATVLTPPRIPAPPQTPTSVPLNFKLGHTVTVLKDGRALVLGRWNGAEIFDPKTGHWSVLPRFGRTPFAHTATMLHDGRVLILGGVEESPGYPLVTVFDPETGNFLDGPAMQTPRRVPAAVLLRDCTVLVVGGIPAGESTNGAEIFEPSTSAWSHGRVTNQRRSQSETVRLVNGHVLAIGRPARMGAEVFDPETRNWQSIEFPPGLEPGPTVLLNDSRVLMLSSNPQVTLPVFGILMDADNVTWFRGTPRPDATWGGTVIRLSDGRILVLGGDDENGTPIDAVDIYDAMNDRWSEAPPLKQPRAHAAGALLKDGRVLLVGGAVLQPNDPEPEIYDPPKPTATFPPRAESLDPEYCVPPE